MYFFLASVFPGCPAGRPTNAHREHPRPRTWSPSTFSPKGRPTVLGTAIPGRAGGRGESDAPPAAAGGSQVTGTQRRRQVPEVQDQSPSLGTVTRGTTLSAPTITPQRLRSISFYPEPRGQRTRLSPPFPLGLSLRSPMGGLLYRSISANANGQSWWWHL